MSADPATQEQRAAIDARDRDVLLEAGAGTGKTTVLVGRFCDAVTVDGAGLDEVLAFTFTDRAAAQLRQRIRLELRARGEERLARQTEAAWISTIHGFCQRLCASHPVALGLDPRYRVLDEPEADRLAARAFDGAVEQFLLEDLPEREQLIAAYRLPRLRRLIRGAHDELRSRGVAAPELPAAAGGEPEHLAAYEGIRELLRLYAGRYAGLKDARSGLDFEDLQLEAVRLLRETRVGGHWRGRFRHVLVDEFQDTNRLQLALVEELRGESTRVFMVGDEQQSIYGFRHADVEVFRGERDRLAALPDAAGQVLPLRGNFRSRTGVLGGVNWVGRALLDVPSDSLPSDSLPSDSLPSDSFQQLTAGDPGAVEAASGARTELLLTPCGRGDKNPWRANGEDPLKLRRAGDDPTREHGVAEARFLAARLRRLHTDDGVPLGDIVLLMRSMTHVAAFEEELERAGLRPYVVGGRGYWSQQQVDDMRCLLGVIADPRDDPALLGALASPACGVLPDTLWLLRRAAGPGNPTWPALGGEPPVEVPAEDGERLRAFRATLTRLRAEAPVLPLEELVDRAARDFDYDLAAASLPGGERRLANIRKLMRLARGYEEAEGRDLPGFLEFLAGRASARDGRPEGQAATQAEAYDGVRIMTVHAAKGLEFPVVAVADLGRKLTGRPPEVLIGRRAGDEDRVGLQLARIAASGERLFDYEELKEAVAEDEVAEECRLAYVAASRAKDRLLLSGCLDDGWDRKELADRSAGRPIIQRLLEGRALAPGDMEIVENDPACFAELTATIQPAPAQAAVTPLAAAPAIAVPPPRQPAAPESGEGLSFGTAVHALLDACAREGWEAPSRQRVVAALGSEGIAEEAEVERADAMVAGFLASPLCDELRGAVRVRSEIPFVLTLGGTPRQGRIDLLAELPGGERLIVDYKTNRLGEAGPAELMADYEEQRQLYALAASAGRPIRTAFVFLDRPTEAVVMTFGPEDLDEIALTLSKAL